MIVKFENYTKIIKKKTILDNLNLVLKSGKIYGLHGRNGSGKTMLLRAISGLILPTSGCVSIDGQKVGKDIEFPSSIGVIIEHMNLVGEYTAKKNLQLLSKINHIATELDINEALIKVGLDPNCKQKVKTFSLGNKQKLNIAQAIMEHPKLILLDEPTNALDADTVKMVRELLLELKENGSLIIIASHQSDDLSILCDEIIEMDEGRILSDEN